MGTRNRNLDVIKGFTIILVTIGHCIQTIWKNDCDSSIIFRIIYSVHMPLFMFISGVTASYTEKVSSYRWLKKRFQGLVIPFTSWIIVFYIIELEYKAVNIIYKIYGVFLHPDTGYWFLWVLFLNSAILYICSKAAKKLGYIIYLSVIIVAVCLHILGISLDYFGIGLCLWHTTFF